MCVRPLAVMLNLAEENDEINLAKKRLTRFLIVGYVLLLHVCCWASQTAGQRHCRPTKMLNSVVDS